MTDKETFSPSKKLILNLLLVVVAAFVFYQVYELTFSSNGTGDRPRTSVSESSVPPKNVVQIDVLNGCGVSGSGQRMTSFLRAAGYDVVDMGNYKTFDVKQSLVIDRSGNADVAKKIAADLGIDPKNVVQEISPEYFVTASVVLGKDFKNLRAWN